MPLPAAARGGDHPPARDGAGFDELEHESLERNAHDADRKDLVQLAREIDRLTVEARDGKIRREDLRDGTFTITSIGSIGGLISTPIINYPEVGILGVGKIVKRPVYDDTGNIRPADLVYLSFSFDHRVVDGAVGAVFGNAVIRHLKNPAALLLPSS